jgi:membrane-bound lytic murein transglycosylase B
VPRHLKAAVLALEGETGPAYWMVFPNFSAIMRYNHSPLYAMAAFELSRVLVEADASRRRPPPS